MLKIAEACTAAMLLTQGFLCSVCSPALRAVNIRGQVQVGGSRLASSIVTVRAATTGEPMGPCSYSKSRLIAGFE